MPRIGLLAVGTALAMLGTTACRGKARSAEVPVNDSGASPALSQTDELLLAAAKVALPPPGFTAPDLPDPHSVGASALATYCAQCHNLPTPSMHSATDWPSVVRRMWLRMERLTGTSNVRVPDAGERAALLNYLIANALHVSGSSLTAGRGREEFALVCSRCHALPDPGVHSAQDWLAVFMRMERNMERMKVRQATAEETDRILSYLQGSAAKR